MTFWNSQHPRQTRAMNMEAWMRQWRDHIITTTLCPKHHGLGWSQMPPNCDDCTAAKVVKAMELE